MRLFNVEMCILFHVDNILYTYIVHCICYKWEIFFIKVMVMFLNQYQCFSSRRMFPDGQRDIDAGIYRKPADITQRKRWPTTFVGVK